MINTQCIEEPLQSSIKSMQSNTNNSNNSRKWKSWEIILLTIGMCVIVFGIINSVAYFIFRHKSKEGEFLLHGDNKH